MKTLGVVIARFQAHQVTPAHEHLLKEAMKNDRVIVLLGVHPVARKRDPLDYAERCAMVQQWFEKNRTLVVRKDSVLDWFVLPMFTHPSDEMWARSVDQQIQALALGGKVTLYCGPDGAGPVYQRAGGRYDVEVVSSYEKHATSVRAALTPRHTEDYRVGVIVASERRFVNPFICVDAFILSQSGKHVLFAKKHGEVLWRMPGGFVDAQECLEAAVIREVKEETGLRTHSPQFVGSAVIDDWRYSDGPENILSACFVVNDHVSSPPAKAADDIAEVEWFELAYVRGAAGEDPSLSPLIHQNHRILVLKALEHLRLAKALEEAPLS